MRILHVFDNEKSGRTFSSYLLEQNIENQLEIFKNTDWSSAEYGDITCKIWIINEDDVNKANEYLEIFLQNPKDPRFIHVKPIIPPPAPTFETFRVKRKAKPSSVITFYTIAICIVIFFISLATTRAYHSPHPGLVSLIPIYSSPVKKAMFYDYPQNYVIIDQLVKAYGVNSLLEPQKLPREGQFLYQKYFKTSYWQGIYDKTVLYLKTPSTPFSFPEPMFEKIRQGEIWRIVSPILIHQDILHLFFNMIWLLVIGRQIESKIGIFRYILFIIIAAIFSNTCQSLMTGSAFLGFSGVLCAMITFVWFRQKQAPWEGYLLLPSTMAFITIFILAIAGIQCISFILEVFGQSSIAPPLANTAHLTGALIGILFSRLKYFTWQK